RGDSRDGYQGEIYPPEFQEFEVRADYRHVRKQRYEPCRDRGPGGINGDEFHELRDASQGSSVSNAPTKYGELLGWMGCCGPYAAQSIGRGRGSRSRVWRRNFWRGVASFSLREEVNW